MGTEKLKFRLELYATMWDKPPHAEILIDDKSYFKGDITSTEDKPSVIEFEHEFEEGKNYRIIIDRSNKGRNQTVLGSDGNIIKDQCLHIKSIEIDEIDIGGLVYEGVYEPRYPEPWFSQQKQQNLTPPTTLKNCTMLGHDGTWTLHFSAPFYMWLLENLY